MNGVSQTTNISGFNNTVETLFQTTILFIEQGDCGLQHSLGLSRDLHFTFLTKTFNEHNHFFGLIVYRFLTELETACKP